MAAVSFPILRLPESALQESLKLMSMRDQLAVSVLSKKTKRLITSVVNKNQAIGYVEMTSSTSILLTLRSRSFTSSIKCRNTQIFKQQIHNYIRRCSRIY
ncbi:F-box domain-containing protein [Caenorhabditis elegans]|uniref:F-box domain-containing protein n=1 Tax=Caenorhabditis elegans TaxID=6239 RepID=Q9N5T4_CAEEL|nr:F-box domain-containing protein [Caenorhabditis elegans]CCD66366.2 F-box domain-containing protein [Caenorhabditis elegans]|eukprot:NP_493880.2 F-box B protein [Caenorhabditis elegans]